MLQPFGCLPNHVCGRGMVKRIKEEYPAIQILPLDYDPDTSFANIENRLQMLIMNARNLEEMPPGAGEMEEQGEEPKAAV
jgi:predicted nucleotide-binding protein (sugar kinase/HSP70/actin superfamily)